MLYAAHTSRPQDQILTCITDASVSAEAALRMIGGGGGAQSVALAEDQVACVLALRGLLGCSVLPHALQKRHLVDYGVDRWEVDMGRRGRPMC